MRSTISNGEARSMSAVRGFRRSVTRESINVMSFANLRGPERAPQHEQQQEICMVRSGTRSVAVELAALAFAAFAGLAALVLPLANARAQDLPRMPRTVAAAEP